MRVPNNLTVLVAERSYERDPLLGLNLAVNVLDEEVGTVGPLVRLKEVASWSGIGVDQLGFALVWRKPIFKAIWRSPATENLVPGGIKGP
jgi:hypothetical protein